MVRCGAGRTHKKKPGTWPGFGVLQRLGQAQAAAFRGSPPTKKLTIFYWLREGSGVMFLIGLLVYIASFFVGGEPRKAAA